MAKTKISEYDATAANNTDIDSINIAEGMAPSNVNNAIRELMAHLKDMDAGTQALTSPQLTSADIDGGTIDGVTIGGASAGAGTFTNLTATGTTALAGASTSADITFGDNDKAVFGAGSDLSIYHDGSDSFITDTGAGNLQIWGGNFRLRSSDGSEAVIDGNSGGAVTLYYDNSPKLATSSSGVDISGTLTSDGLTVDGDANVDGSLTFTNQGVVNAYINSEEGFYFNVDSNNDQSTERVIQFGANASDASGKKIALFQEGGDISFFEDTGTTAKFYWSAADERLGIGTSSPTLTAGATGIDIYDNSDAQIRLHNSTTGTTASDGLLVSLAADNSGYFYNYENAPLIFGTNNTERMRIDSSGNVGIGTSSPATPLHIVTSGNTAATFHSTTDNSNLVFTDASTTANVAIGAVSGDNFRVQIANAERMRIDSSGNLLVGTTDINPGFNDTNTGSAIRSAGSIFTSVSGSTAAYFNRNTNDGEIVSFRKGGAPVGSIGTAGSDLVMGTGASAIRFRDSTPELQPWNVTTNALVDATMDIGGSNRRFKDLYLSGGVYLGGTGAANKLDDVESGSWTPIYQNTGGTHTYDLQQGHYYKVGPQVFASFRISAASTSGWNTALDIQVGGLPFVQDATIDGLQNRGTFEAIYFTIDSNTNYDLAGIAGSTYLLIRKSSSGGSNVSANYSDMTSQTSCQIRGLFIYRTSA